jgi:Abnormal spindle-like microcephaly-assoc'd, ASPM-SPD-2-Hydin/Beta-propeller repeat
MDVFLGNVSRIRRVIARATLAVFFAVVLLPPQPAAAQASVFQQYVERVDVVHGPDVPRAIGGIPNGYAYYIAGEICLAISPTGACTESEMQLEAYQAGTERIWGASLKASGPFASATALAVQTNSSDEDTIYITGWGQTNTGTYEFLTVKYNAAGTRQWIVSFPLGSSLGPSGIGVDTAGNVYVTGLSSTGPNTGNIETISYDTNGKVRWKTELGESYLNVPAGLVVSPFGVYVTGTISYPDGSRAEGITVMYDLNTGNILAKDFVTSSDADPRYYNTAIFLDSAQNYVYVAGHGTKNVSGTLPPSHEYAIEFDRGTLTRLWMANYQTPGTANGGGDSPTALVADNLGNAYTTGSVFYSGGTSDISTVKLNSSGVVWQRLYNGSGTGNDRGVAITANAGGNCNPECDIWVTGQSTSPTGNGLDYATFLYLQDGTQEWVARYNGPGNGDDVPTGIWWAPTVINGAIVTGSSTGAGTGLDWTTVGYRQDALQPTPASLTFGPQAVGTSSAPRTVTITNTNPYANEAPQSFSFALPSSDFQLTNDTCVNYPPPPLQPGQSCTVTVIFAPQSAGTKNAQLQLFEMDNGTPSIAVPLTGTAQ